MIKIFSGAFVGSLIVFTVVVESRDPAAPVLDPPLVVAATHPTWTLLPFCRAEKHHYFLAKLNCVTRLLPLASPYQHCCLPTETSCSTVSRFSPDLRTCWSQAWKTPSQHHVAWLQCILPRSLLNSDLAHLLSKFYRQQWRKEGGELIFVARGNTIEAKVFITRELKEVQGIGGKRAGQHCPRDTTRYPKFTYVLVYYGEGRKTIGRRMVERGWRNNIFEGTIIGGNLLAWMVKWRFG